MRKLIVVPMVHLLEEVSWRVHRLFAESFTPSKNERMTESVLKSLVKMTRWLFEVALKKPETLAKTHIFFDGLAQNFTDKQIRNYLERGSDLGSVAATVTLHLVRIGAKIHGTEDPQLLKEYGHYQDVLVERTRKARKLRSATSPTVRDLICSRLMLQLSLTTRDVAIAERIDSVVADGEIGLLFIGKDHKVGAFLKEMAPDFEIIYPNLRRIK